MTHSITPARAKELATAVISAYSGAPIDSTASMSEIGAVNTVVRVTAGAGAFVVRMRGETEALAEYGKERWCLQRARAAGIPGPEVLQIGSTDGVPYMIETCMNGVPGGEFRDGAELWRCLGRYARRIHAIPVTGFGDELSETAHNLFEDAHARGWPAYARGTWFLRRWLPFLAPCLYVGGQAASRIREPVSWR